MGVEAIDTAVRSVALVYVAHVFGWVYFLAWTLSFYPQLIVNFKNRSTEGLSYDFATYNLIGFFSYCVYAIIRFVTQRRYNLPHAVELQDLCFALHAFALCVLLAIQIATYDRHAKHRFSQICIWATSACVLLYILNALMVIFGFQMVTTHPGDSRANYAFSWWTFTEFAATLKIVVTLVKYFPQIYLNYRRKMTKGMAVWQFNLDAVGGVLSLSQNGIEAINYRDITFITGNYPKMIIGMIGLTYDAILLLQHYVIYRANNRGTQTLATVSRKDTTTQHSMPSFELTFNPSDPDADPK